LHLELKRSPSSCCTRKDTGRLGIMSESPRNVSVSKMLSPRERSFYSLIEYSGRNIRMGQIVLRRRESRELKKARGWLLVYGRRKVGKTFLLRKELAWSIYATVTRSREIFLESDGGIEKTRLEEGIRRIVNALKRGECVVIDEFQRLPENYWDLLALAHPSGRLVLSGSSFGVVEKVFSRRSPLLGLVNPLRIDVVSYADAVSSLLGKLGPEKALLWAILVRDPWVIPFADLSLHPAVFIAENAGRLAIASTGLVGEVFVEEERRLTTLYEAVLRLLAEGYWKPAEIAGVLAPRGLLEGGAPRLWVYLSEW